MLYSLFSITTLLILSVLLLFSGDLLVFWLVSELCSLVIIPCFYNNDSSNNSLANMDCLLYYLLALGISSSLILVGILFPDMFFFFFFGLVLKFGVFPFFFWVYQVLDGSKSWIICWVLSSVFKISVLYLSYFMYNYNYGFIIFLCSLGLIFAGLFIWLYNGNWFILWCHMMLSSSNVIFCLSVCSSFLNVLIVYLIYFFWSTGVIYYLSGSEGGILGYVLWLIAIPLSFAFFYKIYVSYLLVGVWWGLVFLWFFYSFLEQFYLFKWLVSTTLPKTIWWGSVTIV